MSQQVEERFAFLLPDNPIVQFIAVITTHVVSLRTSSHFDLAKEKAVEEVEYTAGAALQACVFESFEQSERQVT